MKSPCALMASAGSNGEAVPLPSMSLPHEGHVPGMNWAMPCAPTGEVALGFQPDSASSCAAIAAGVTAGHFAPAACTNAR